MSPTISKESTQLFPGENKLFPQLSHPPGFKHLLGMFFVKGTVPIEDREGRALFFMVPLLKREFSKLFWRWKERKLKIKNRENYQVVILGSDDYGDRLKEELEKEDGMHPVATVSQRPYANDFEKRIIIGDERKSETVYIVASPKTERDFAMISNTAGHYKRILGATRVVLIAPFFGFAREDKNAELLVDGEVKRSNKVITIASRMGEVCPSVDEMIVFEPHSGAVQVWAAENKTPLAPISMWKLMLSEVKKDLKEDNRPLRNLVLVRADEGRNLATLRMERDLGIGGVALEKKRDESTQEVHFNGKLAGGEIKELEGKDILIYDDEGATLGTIKGVIGILMDLKISSINIMLGHARFVDGYYDSKKGFWHKGWEENMKQIIKEAKEKGIKVRFYISNSRKPIGDIRGYAKEHKETIKFVDVSPMIKEVIEASAKGVDFWQDEKWRDIVAQPYPEEVGVVA